jgi:hypothetical protein
MTACWVNIVLSTSAVVSSAWALVCVLCFAVLEQGYTEQCTAGSIADCTWPLCVDCSV